MKLFITIIFLIGIFAIHANGRPATLKVLDISISEEECVNLARQVANRYVKDMKVTFDGPAITFKERYSFAINCLERYKVVHIFTDKNRNEEHQAIFDDFIKSFKEINKSKQ